MLQWVLFCQRLLNSEEIFFAVKAGMASESLGPWNRSVLAAGTILICTCSSSKGVIEVLNEDKISVHFIHFSVNKFLVQNQRLQLWRKKLPTGHF